MQQIPVSSISPSSILLRQKKKRIKQFSWTPLKLIKNILLKRRTLISKMGGERRGCVGSDEKHTDALKSSRDRLIIQTNCCIKVCLNLVFSFFFFLKFNSNEK